MKKIKKVVVPTDNDKIIKIISEFRQRCAWLITLPDKKFNTEKAKLVQLLFEIPIFDEALIYLRLISENFKKYRIGLEKDKVSKSSNFSKKRVVYYDALENIEQFLLDSTEEYSSTLLSFNALHDYYAKLYHSDWDARSSQKLEADFGGDIKSSFAYSINSMLNFLFDYYVNGVDFSTSQEDSIMLSLTRTSLEGIKIKYDNSTLSFGELGSIKFSPEKSSRKNLEDGTYNTGKLFEIWSNKNFKPIHFFDVKAYMTAGDLRAIIDKQNKRLTALFKAGKINAHIQIVATAKDASGYKAYKFAI